MDFFDYFQIVALVLFSLLFIARSAQMFRRGINPFVIGAGKKGFNAAIEILFPVGLVAWTTELVSHALKLRFHIFPSVVYANLFDFVPVKIAGSFFIAAGLVIFALSLIAFGNSWRIGIDKQKPGSLVTHGIFSFTRNPIFIFIDAYFISAFLVYPNLFFLAFAVVTVAGIHYHILQEEKFLEEHYGEEYRNYKGKVRRYF